MHCEHAHLKSAAYTQGIRNMHIIMECGLQAGATLFHMSYNLHRGNFTLCAASLTCQQGDQHAHENTPPSSCHPPFIDISGSCLQIARPIPTNSLRPGKIATFQKYAPLSFICEIVRLSFCTSTTVSAKRRCHVVSNYFWRMQSQVIKWPLPTRTYNLST